MVKEDEKKTEKKTKRMNDLESCNNSVKLLNDMLVHFDPAVTSEGERDLMRVGYFVGEEGRGGLAEVGDGILNGNCVLKNVK